MTLRASHNDTDTDRRELSRVVVHCVMLSITGSQPLLLPLPRFLVYVLLVTMNNTSDFEALYKAAVEQKDALEKRMLRWCKRMKLL